MKRIFARNNWVKNAAGAILFCLLLAAIPCAAFAPPSERITTKASGDLVNVSIDFGDDAPEVPFNALNHALASCPQIHRFRMTWTDGELEIFHNYTALYDRRKHTVTIYSTAVEGDNGGRTSFSGYWRYTKVREADFQKIAAVYKSDRGNQDWFDYLPKYGCREHDLGLRQQ